MALVSGSMAGEFVAHGWILGERCIVLIIIQLYSQGVPLKP
jgi:hypothetical protein